MDLLRSMRIFVRVAEASSFTLAAEQLDIATAQASRAVTELETHLRTRLLNRTTRRVALTDAGNRYQARCKDVLALVDLSEAEASNAQVSPSGVLRMHAPITFGQHYVVPALTRYLKAHPLVRVELTLSQHVPDMLDEGYDKASARSSARRDINLSGQRRPALPSGRVSPINPCQLAGLRAVTIHTAPLIITERSPGRLAKAARTAAEARARMSSG